MYDSHAHLCTQPISENIQRHLQEFKDAGGEHILNVSFDVQSISDVITQSIEYENTYPNLIQTGIGIHPEHISDDSFNLEKGMDFLIENLRTHRKRISAIGECGLDYYHFSFMPMLDEDKIEQLKEQQRILFRKHIEIAVENNLPLSVHTRDSKEDNRCSADSLKIVASAGKGNARGVFHSYTGSIDYLKEILDLGFYVGFNGIITYPKAENVREILKAVPLNKMLIETDAPFLPPQNVRNGKSGEVKYGKPIDVAEIALMIAKVKGITIEKTWEILNENYSKLFLTN